LKIHDVAIIGAGPAGVAAAIQLKRYNIIPVLIERNEVGGLLRNANLVENYPGFPKGIAGSDLVNLLRKHLKETGIQITHETVLSIDHSNRIFQVKTDRSTFACRFVILATGTQAKKLLTKGVKEAVGSRVFFEVYPLCDMKGKKIAVIGAGDAAFDYALNISLHNRVVINNRRNRVSCLPVLWERANDNLNIDYRDECVLRNVNPSETGLELTWKQNDREWKEQYDFLLIAIGRAPLLDYLSQSIQSRLKEFENEGLIYPIGDLKNGRYRQMSISIGDGVKAAMQAAQKLTEIERCK